MSSRIMVLSRHEDLLGDLQSKLLGFGGIVCCESADQLALHLKAQRADAVLVHLSAETVGEQSPVRFMAAIREVIDGLPLMALIGADCPAQLQALARRTADDCLTIPQDYERLHRLLMPRNDLGDHLAGPCRALPHYELRGTSRSLLTFTPEMFDMLDEIRLAARHHVTVLLIGETGSGKTFLARLIHELSSRQDRRFCTVACGALPPELIESELFGHVQGAFTGADRDREGKFAAAGQGTLLLDEIDVLPPEQQAKLLRVIETGEYEPVGSNETRLSQARLVAASNVNLEELVRAGRFRTDLYYRLNVLSFRLLPLRRRPLDIEYLARKFASEHGRLHGIDLNSIEPAFLEALQAYLWPGNVRELENVIRRAVLYCRSGSLTLSDLPSSIRCALQPPETVSHPLTFARVAARGVHDRAASEESRPESVADEVKRFRTGTVVFGRSMTAFTSQAATLEARVDVMERRIIEDTLARNSYRRKETAAELGISRVTLYNKMKKFGLM